MSLIRMFLPVLILLMNISPVRAAELMVFAASSLTDALPEVVQHYQTEHPNDQILLNFSGSQMLATQIEQGAPADLLISANQQIMQRLQKGGLVTHPQPLLRNRLVLAVRTDLSPPITTLSDLARPDLLLAIGNRQVPVGRYTRQLFAGLAADPQYGPALVARFEQNIVSEESRVKVIIAKLLLGEVDAGIVYQSDFGATNSSKLTAIPLPERHNPQALYPLAKVRNGKVKIDDFMNFLYSRKAREIFTRHAFLWGGEQ